MAGQTLDKKVAGIRVVTLSAQDVAFVKSVLRRLFDPVDMFFFVLVALMVMKSSDKRQRVGDLVAKIIVIKDVVEACGQCRENFSLRPSEILDGRFTCPNCHAENSIGNAGSENADPTILDNFDNLSNS